MSYTKDLAPMHILFLAPILPALWLAYKAFRSPYPWPVPFGPQRLGHNP